MSLKEIGSSQTQDDRDTDIEMIRKTPRFVTSPYTFAMNDKDFAKVHTLFAFQGKCV